MRAYFFVNSWLSGIQKGLQTAHCVAEMADDAETPNARTNLYREWAKVHKTIIVLEGGPHAGLVELVEFFGRQFNLPWASFSEDEESLNGAMTCVGIIVPEDLYERAKMVREGDLNIDQEELRDPKDIWEAEFIDILNSCSLAS